MLTRTAPLGAAIAVVLMGCSSDINLDNEVNVPPAVLITAPETGSRYEATELVRLEGVVSDGNRLGDISRVWWQSDLDGELGTEDLTGIDDLGNTRFETALSNGLHTITLAATDGAGETATDTISVEVVGGVQLPIVEFIQPEEFDSYEIGDDIDIVALVSDPQDMNDELMVTISWEDANSGGVPTLLYDDFAAANGTIRLTWEEPPVGAYSLVLAAEDTDGNISDVAITVFVADPNDIDNDGDGFSTNTGDCDDANGDAYPGAPETCGDGDDNDCNGTVDDADLDRDQHIDEDCAAYTGPLPVDDCDDDAGTVFPGATESLNSIDDDCDSYVDEGTVVFDDDGDCFCEQGPCTGSFANCSTVPDGDCNDTNNSVYPGASDTPDAAYTDENCDGIDGVSTEGAFVSTTGSDSGDCPISAPCATVAYAVSRAAATNRPFVNIQAGTYVGSVPISSDVTLVGGFDSAWERSVRGDSGHAARLIATTLGGEYIGIRVRGASFRAMDLELAGANVSSSQVGSSTYVVHSALSSTVTLERVDVNAGDAAPGGTGSSGIGGPNPSNRDGARGGNGDNYGSTQLCRLSRSTGGSGGINSSCPGSTQGGRGGAGGAGDRECCTFVNSCALCGGGGCDAQGGSAGSNASIISTTNGRGGAAGGGDADGSCNDSIGTGTDGASGVVGTDGAGGTGATAGGVIESGLWWRARSGGAGNTGANGGGGGGGGGAGACDNGFFGSDFGGNAGGGGGAGGCRASTAGQGGSGAGGSFGVFAVGGSVNAIDTRFTLGTGGRGGNGGDGANGGGGGGGGIGGQSTGFEAGRGGNGGRGGHSGGGGGGGGGHSVAIYSVGAAATQTGSSATAGGPGAGGTGGRSPANTSTTNGRNGSTGVTGLIVTHSN